MRHEEKYIYSERQLLLLEKRLSAIMESDVNQTGTDYRIRSLYFDTFDDRFYNECLSGVDKRRKYRIRFYNMDDAFFRAERKDTEGALKQKYSSAVTKEYVEVLLSGGNIPEGDGRVTEEMHAMQLSEGLHPVVVIDYRRTAFTYPLGNIRITFDRDICCTARTDELLDPHALLYPVMPPGKHVLEVKYDNILPGFIRRVLDAESPGRISFSKYAYSRSLIEGNGRKEDGYDI
ncbi:MAG: polyphosphate polymerase domain-containing protein [Lachnospiraceae bacterium]|nr:polyphosphate polymerase domain-containing protein [Lachnospiraceae bacterium]